VILFLTNNNITKPLINWLKQKEKVIILNKKITKRDIQKLKPDLIISYNYKYIISKDLLDNRFINLHISYLPYNKGAYPNIFSHLQNTPKGVTIHLIDEGIDSGAILFQKRVVLNKNETLKQSYKKLHLHIQRIFKANYIKIKNQKFHPKNQKQKGTINFIKDLNKVILPSYDIRIKELKELNENIQL